MHESGGLHDRYRERGWIECFILAVLSFVAILIVVVGGIVGMILAVPFINAEVAFATVGVVLSVGLLTVSWKRIG